MAYYKVAVVNEDKRPLVDVDVEAVSLLAFPTVLDTQTTDRAGSCSFEVSGPVFFRPRVRRTSATVGGRIFTGRVDVQVVAFGQNMNVDYVVDSNGMGTHETLFGSAGAFTEAIATGADRVIWVCTSHTETATSTTSLSGLAAQQRITIMSGGPYRPYIIRGFSGTLFSMSTASGSNSGIRFQGIDFQTTTGTGSQDFCEAASGVGTPDMELIDVGFDAATGTTWKHIVNLETAGSASSGRLTLTRVKDYGGSVLNICRLVSASSSTGSFWMDDCDFLGLETVSNRAASGENSNVDWGLGSSNQQLGILISNCRLNISRVLWRRTFNVPFRLIGNQIRCTHGSGTYMLDIGTAGTVSPQDVTITGNTISVHTSGANGIRVQDAGGGTAENITIMGNAMAGPGNGIAIQLNSSPTSTTQGYAVLNSYRDWATNVDTPFADFDYTGITASGTSIDHGFFTGLTDDDHTQYALLAGRSGGQTLIGGTATGNNLTLRSNSFATPGDGSILFEDASFGVQISSSNPRIFFDTTADRISYDRANNRLAVIIGNTEVFRQVAAGTLSAGYLHVGALTAPANTTAGDMHGNRILIGTDTAFTLGNIYAGYSTHTDTSGNPLQHFHSMTVANTGASTATFESLRFQIPLEMSANISGGIIGINSIGGVVSATTGADMTGSLRGFRAQGIFIGGTPAAVRTFAAVTGLQAQVMNRSGSPGNWAITIGRAIHVIEATRGGGSSITFPLQVGIDIEPLTAGDVNIGLRNASSSVFTPSTAQVIDAVGDVILANATTVRISNSTGASITLTSTPTIASGEDGQILIIRNVGANDVVLQDQGTLASSNLRLTAATITLTTRDTIILQYDSTVGDWVQIAPIGVPV